MNPGTLAWRQWKGIPDASESREGTAQRCHVRVVRISVGGMRYRVPLEELHHGLG